MSSKGSNHTHKSRKEMYKDIYKVTYVANINRMIDENRYIDVLQKLSMNGFKTYHIDDFDKLTIHLQTIGLKNSFNISILIHLRDTNYKKLSEIAVLFEDIGVIFSNKRIEMTQRVSAIRDIIQEKITLIKSFKKIEGVTIFKKTFISTGDLDFDDKMNSSDQLLKSNLLYTEIPSTERNTNKSSNKRREIKDIADTRNETIKKLQKPDIMPEWLHYTRNDIINRLHLLAQKHFTLNQLIFMDVELKTINQIMDMSYINLEKYYLTVVSAIDHSLKEWSVICKMYIDIEINYVECCNNIMQGRDTILNLKHFNIDICDNTK